MSTTTDRMRALSEETAAIHVDFLSPVVRMATEAFTEYDWTKAPANLFKRAVLRAASGPASFDYVSIGESRIGFSGSFSPHAGDDLKSFNATLFSTVEHAAKGTEVNVDVGTAPDGRYEFECLAVIGARRPVGYVTAILVYRRVDPAVSA